MKTRDALTWFKTNFGPKLEPAVAGTPFNIECFRPARTRKAAKFGWCSLINSWAFRKFWSFVGDTLDGRSATSSAPTIYFVGWVISGRALAGGKPER